MKQLQINIFNNQKAYEQFFNENYNALCRFAYTYLKDSDHSADIVQNSFVKLWENKDKTKITTSIKAYLYTTVRNTCLNELKHGKIKETYKQHIISTSTQSSSLVDEIEASELQEKINFTVASMPDQRRIIFKMSRYEGMKYNDIAEKLSLSPKTVANHMGLAIKYLRVELQEYLHIGLLFFLLEGLGNYTYSVVI